MRAELIPTNAMPFAEHQKAERIARCLHFHLVLDRLREIRAKIADAPDLDELQKAERLAYTRAIRAKVQERHRLSHTPFPWRN